MALNSCAQKVIINREIDTPEYGKMLLGSQSLRPISKRTLQSLVWWKLHHLSYR